MQCEVRKMTHPSSISELFGIGTLGYLRRFPLLTAGGFPLQPATHQDPHHVGGEFGMREVFVANDQVMKACKKIHSIFL